MKICSCDSIPNGKTHIWGDVARPRDCNTEQSKSERETHKISHVNEYMQNLENGRDEPICKVEIETQMQTTDVWIPR